MILQIKLQDLRNCIKEKCEEIISDKKLAYEVYWRICDIEDDERFKMITKEQPVVILCKDCKFYDSETGICAKGITHGYDAEWFCGDGKGGEEE